MLLLILGLFGKGAPMNSLKFELKKFNSRLLWLMLLIIPVVVMASLFAYQVANPPTIKYEESQTANRLLSDLNWVLPRYRSTLSDASPDEISNNLELSQLEEIYTHLNEAEKARFKYSVAAWHEDWVSLNQAKQEIWAHLIASKSAGATFTSLNADLLEAEKQHLDWLVTHEVDYLVPAESQQSLFLLNQSLDFLFSLPMILLLVLLYGLKVFDDFESKQQNFSLVLPIKKRKLIVSKLGSFALMLIVYMLTILGMTIILAMINTETSPLVQLSYPLIIQAGDNLATYTLSAVLVFRLLFFVLNIFLLLALVLVLNHVVRNSLATILFLGSACLIGVQLTELKPTFNQFYNPFAWLDVSQLMSYASNKDLWLALLLMLILLAFLVFLITRQQTRENQTAKTRFWHPKLKQGNFLLRFQLLKDRREGLYLFTFLLMAVGIAALVMNNQQLQQANLTTMNQDLSDYVSYLEIYKSDLDLKSSVNSLSEQEHELLKLLEEEINLYQAKQGDIANGDYTFLIEREAMQLESDYAFLTSQAPAPGSSIPMSHAIFMPNAYLNAQLKEWKTSHAIQFVPPGGPYKTAYMPGYEESPRSGVFEAPFAIDQALFQNYLDERSSEHWMFAGWNSLLDFINQYLYVLLLALSILFFSQSFVKERDGHQNIRFLLVSPVSEQCILTSKMLAAFISTVVLLSGSLLLLFLVTSLMGGIGSLDFPVIEYLAPSVGDTHLGLTVLTIPLTRQSFVIHPLWRILLMGLALLVTSIGFISQLHYLLSVWVKNLWSVLLILLVILIGGVLLTEYIEGSWLAYSPFSYLNLPAILSGELAVRVDQSNIHIITGMISQITSATIMTIIAQVYVRKGRLYDIS